MVMARLAETIGGYMCVKLRRGLNLNGWMDMPEALAHLKVLDLSRILAGPWATQILADLGADVERPVIGDDTRGWGPPFLQAGNGQPTPDSAYFLSANRGKKSITLDISTKEGQDVIKKMVMSSDVLVENYKTGGLRRYGLSYLDLKELNPRLIYCSITGFGQTGPYSHRPGYDFVFQGMSGLMSITGQPEGEPGDEPMKMGVAISDMLSGMYAVTAILAAVESRRETGEGQHIDISLLDCTTAVTSYQAGNYFMSGSVPRRLGNAHPNMVPYQVFRCADGDIVVAVGNDKQFAAFCGLLCRPDLATNPDYVTVSKRVSNRAVLLPQIAEVMLTRTTSDWLELMEVAGVPGGPINNIKQVFEDPQIQHRGMLKYLAHGAGVSVATVSNPIRFSGTPIICDRAPPLLGEHTEEVLRDQAVLSEDAISDLRARGVI
jgi:crotonobetainyl-CoA:carnitine CoA-transferase CaiB-like acyl-CoA transferase